MDRKTELAHLAIADKAVADGHRHIAQQEQRLSDLDRDGHDTQKASALLASTMGLALPSIDPPFRATDRGFIRTFLG